MDKKLLVSLMMTAPVAAFAANGHWEYSNADGGDLSYAILPLVNSQNWAADGISSGFNTDPNGTLVCPVSTGSLKHKAMLTATGVYTFNATVLENAYFIVNGEAKLDRNGNPLTSFTLGNVGTVTIEVKPVNKDLNFSVGKVSMKLDFKFSTAKEMLDKQYKLINVVDVYEDDDRSKADELRAAAKEYRKQLTAVLAQINTINLENADALALAYTNLNLISCNPADFSKSSDKVSTELKRLQEAIGLAIGTDPVSYPKDTYNYNADAENKAWDNILANRTALENLNKEVEKLQAALDKKADVESTIPDSSIKDETLKQYCHEALKKDLADQQTAIDALKAAIDKAYPIDAEGNPPTTEVKDDFSNTISSITTAIGNISYESAKKDYTAYVEFLSYRTQFAFQYDKLFGIINNDFRISTWKVGEKPATDFSKANVYDDETGIANNKLADAYENNTGYDITEGALIQTGEVDGKPVYKLDVDKIGYIMGAAADLDKVEAQMRERNEGMEAARDYIKEIFDREQKALTGDIYGYKNDDNGVSKYVVVDHATVYANQIIGELQKDYNAIVEFAGTDAYKSIEENQKWAADLKSLRDKIGTSITTLITKTNELYEAHKLDVENTDNNPFFEAKNNVTTAIDNYNNYLKDTVGINGIDLLDLYNKTVGDVKELTAKVDEGRNLNDKFGDSLNDRFASSFKHIKAGIDKYLATEVDDRTQAAYDDIKKSLEDVLKDCKTLVAGFNAALTEITTAQTNLNALKKELGEKLIIPGGKFKVDKEEYQKEANDYDTEINGLNGYLAQLKNIVSNEALNVQEAYEQANKVCDEVKASDLALNIKTTFEQYIKEVTNANSDNVKAMIEAIEKYTTDPTYKDYPGMPENKVIDPVTGKVIDINALYNEAVKNLASSYGDAPALRKIDADLDDIVKKCATINAAIQKSLDNRKAYEELMAKRSDLYNTISSYAAPSNLSTITVAPAIAYYNGKFNELLKQLGQDLANVDKNDPTSIAGEYTGSYKNVNLSDESVKTGYVNDIDGVKTAFENLKKDLAKNQSNYADLNSVADEVSNLINNANKMLDQFDDVKYTDKTKEDLKKKTEDLGNLNDEITEIFGKGGLIDDELVNSYKDQYDEYTTAVNGYLNEWTGGYHQAVKDHNNNWFKAHDLGNKILDDMYVKATNYVNQYLYDTGYGEYNSKLVENDSFKKNHSDLQTCFKRIEVLNSLLGEYISKATPETVAPNNPADLKEYETYLNTQVVLSDEYNTEIHFTGTDYKGTSVTVNQKYLVDEANAIKTLIKTCLEKIDEEGYNTATEYWDNNGKLAVDTWNSIKDRLVAAGISDVKDPKTKLSELDGLDIAELATLSTLEESYNTYKSAVGDSPVYPSEAVHEYILAIWKLNSNVNKLLPEGVDREDADDVKEYENGQVAEYVNEFWNNLSSSAVTELETLENGMSSYTEGDGYDENLKTITDAKNKVNEYIENWDEFTNDERENTYLADYKAQIKQLLKDANDASEDAKVKADIADKNNTAYNGVVKNDGCVYKTTESGINDLLAWSWYRNDQVNKVQQLLDKLEEARYQVWSNTRNNKPATTVEAQTKVFNNKFGKNTIKDAYQSIFGMEVDFANNMMVALNSAFNNVNELWTKNAGEAGLTEEQKTQLNDWNNAISEIQSYLGSAKAGYTYDKRDACKEALETTEKNISSLIEELEAIAREGGFVTADKIQETISALNEVYKTVSDQINEFVNNDVDTAQTYQDQTMVPAAQTAAKNSTNEMLELLSDYQNGYTNDGANVIQDASKFSYDMKLILKELTEVQREWDLAYNGNPRGETIEELVGARQVDCSNYYYAVISQKLNNYWTWTSNAQKETELQAEDPSDKETYIAYDVTLYNSINVIINGSKNVAGQITKLNNAKASYTIDENTETNLPKVSVDGVELTLEQGTYEFVRETLKAVAEDVQTRVVEYAKNQSDYVAAPGLNDNDFEQKFIDWEGLQKSINAVKTEANNEDVEEIVKVKIQDKPVKYKWNNPVEANAKYDAILEALSNYKAQIETIVTDAKEDKLYTIGDVDGNQKLNVLDVQTLINLVLEHAVVLPNDKKTHAADITNDGDINVGDVTYLINWILNPNDASKTSTLNRLRRYLPSFSGSNSYNVYEVQGENGNRRFAVLLTNETAFSAGQLDIKLPSHASVAGVSLGERANGLDVYYNENSDCTTVVMTALDGTMINGNNGCVLFIDVEGNAEVEVENVIFSDQNGKAYHLNSNGESGVGILDSMKDGVKAIYNAAGQKLNKLTKGVNIIRNADGSVTKKMGK